MGRPRRRSNGNRTVSLILDMLRRKPATPPDDEPESDPEQSARSDAVLATLGYSKSAERPRAAFRTMVAYGAAALVLGFAGLSLLILLLAPSAPSTPPPRAAAPSAGKQNGTSAPPVLTPRLTPSPPQASSPSPSTSPPPSQPLVAPR